MRINRTTPRGICFYNGGSGIARGEKPPVSSIRAAFALRLSQPPGQADFTNAFLHQTATDLYQAGKCAIAALGAVLCMPINTLDGQAADLPTKFEQLIFNTGEGNLSYLNALLADGLPIDQNFQALAIANQLTFQHIPKDLIEKSEEQMTNSKALLFSYYYFALDRAFYFLSNNPDESMLWFKTAILFLPDNYHAYVYVAGILYKNKQVDKAAEIYSAMIPLLPEEGKGLGYYQRSVCFHEMGKLAEEEKDLKQALSLLPSLTQAQFNLATIYMTTNRQEQAKPMFMDAAEQLPEGKKARAFLNIGVILMRMGQNDEAIMYFKQAVEDDRNYASAYFNWGMVLANNADTLNEALEKLEKAIELEPANPITQYFIGVLLYHLGRKQEAFAWCRDRMLGQEADEHTIIAFLAQSEKIEQQ